jgi:hypothetical protein
VAQPRLNVACMVWPDGADPGAPPVGEVAGRWSVTRTTAVRMISFKEGHSPGRSVGPFVPDGTALAGIMLGAQAIQQHRQILEGGR